MELQVTEDEKLSKKFLITYTAEDIKNCLIQEAEKMQPEVKLNGFRPGKVPTDYIIRMYGEKIRVDGMNNRVNDDVIEIIRKNDFRLAVSPIYNFKERKEVGDENFYVEVGIYLFPDVPEVDFAEVEVEQLSLDESAFEEVVDKNLLMFQVVSSQFEPKEDEIAEHDRVKCNIEVVIEGEVAAGMSGEQLFLVGHEQIPAEIEAEIIGMKQGEKKDYQHFYDAEGKKPFFYELVGKNVTFNIEVLEVQSPLLEELGQEKIEKLGFESPDQLIKVVKDNSKAMLDKISHRRAYQEVIDYIKKEISFDIAGAVLDQEAHEVAYNSASSVNGNDAKKEMFDGNKTVAVTDAHKEIALGNLKLSFVLSEYAKKNNIKVEDWEVKKEMEMHISELQKLNETNPDQKEKNYKDYMARVQAIVFETKVVNAIFDVVNKKEVFLSKDEFFQDI